MKESKIGDIVKLGVYPQAADETDKAPIEWRVLENNNGKLLLLSENLIDCSRYHKNAPDITWRNSDLRKWLNDDFYNAAFNSQEKSLILSTVVSGNGAVSANSLPTAQDNVFLLNTAEAEKYFANDKARLAEGTDYAKIEKSRICKLYIDDASGKSGYWLRNQGRGGAFFSAYVDVDGYVTSYGTTSDCGCYGIRPVIRIRV
jgi:hypothetical protein